jgi:outer membrane lipoprotein-sorting protein
MISTLRTSILGGFVIAGVLIARASAQGDAAGFEHLLTQMDASAKSFRTAQTNVVWDQYDKVINETEIQKGKFYFRREGGEVQMAADFAEPDKKYVIYSGGKVQVYQPKIDQINEYDAGKNRGDVESFLVLGFGGAGHDLQKSYDVKFLGPETVSGVAAQKLELTPKSTHLRNNLSRILLWIDPARGVAVQQQFFEPTGNFRLAKYSDIQINQKLHDNAFKLKTTSKTKVIAPQS